VNKADTKFIRRSDFPANFLWGSSTSSYQIEGASRNDDRGISIWDTFCAKRGNIRDGSSGDVACDHFHRWPGDLSLAKDLGTNAYRFSIAWPRIFPNGVGVAPNQKGLDFYSRLVDGMLERGLEPWATLYHWDLPQALQDQGGWANRSTVDAFVRYTDVVSKHFSDRIKNWITHNEPWCTAFNGNYEGVHAPGIKDFKIALQVCHHVLLSHGLAIPVIRRNVLGARVGAALSLHPLHPASDSDEDAAATKRHDGLRNRWFLDALHGRGYPVDVWTQFGDKVPRVREGDLDVIATPTDFLGINYYFPEVVANEHGSGILNTKVVENDDVERTAFGWEVCPKGMVDLLARVHRDYRPAEIYLTENGSTYEDVLRPDGEVHDEQRLSFLIRHLQAARQVVDQGIPLKGYFAWSLLDNFEWAEGFGRRFGLTYVDFDTQRRTLKASGKWYRAFLHGTN